MGQTDEGGGNAVCLWIELREEVQLKSGAEVCGTEGGGSVRRLIDKAVYAVPGPFPQCVNLYASHALHAGKVSASDLSEVDAHASCPTRWFTGSSTTPPPGRQEQ